MPVAKNFGTFYGAGGNTSPWSHQVGLFGAFQSLNVQFFAAPASVAANVANTVEQGYTFFPFAYGWLYDIVVSCTDARNSTTTGTGAVTVDVGDGHGSSFNSYLSSPITLVGSGAAQGTHTGALVLSARFSACNNAATADVYPLSRDPEAGGSYQEAWITGSTNSIPNYFQRGQIFSVRAVTPNNTGALISNLTVQICVVPSDYPSPMNG